MRGIAISLFLGFASAGTVVWDGRFNDYATATDLDKWSFKNLVGSYQWYIHGSGATTDYVNFSPDYKNPADTVSRQGVKITINPTSLWKNQTMWRTELVPQTNANIGTGNLFYHFSLKKCPTNPPQMANEHQINFFENHFTELKYGGNTNGGSEPDNHLRWFVNKQCKWDVEWEADVWHNFAYDIDFNAGTVKLWHSTGSDPLSLIAGPFPATTFSDSKDWHLGVLRLPNPTDYPSPEDWYYSGVYVETGPIDTAICGNNGNITRSYAASTVPSLSYRPPAATTASSSAAASSYAAARSSAPASSSAAASSPSPTRSSAAASSPSPTRSSAATSSPAPARSSAPASSSAATSSPSPTRSSAATSSPAPARSSAATSSFAADKYCT